MAKGRTRDEMPAGKKIRANGIDLHVIDAGTGIPVVLLHGFPDSSYLWRHQLPALTAAGFRVIAPDLRGFGLSDRPDEVNAYQMPHLIADVRGIMDALDVKRAHVVGHDWGAALAWAFATFEPDRVDRLAVLSVGHPSSFRRLNLRQLQKSWYMLFFQFRGIAERTLQADNWGFFRRWLGGVPDLDRYIEQLSRPGALTAALNWYRANASPEALLSVPKLPPVEAATMGIWSSGDLALTEEQMTGSADYVRGPWRYERLEGIAHWIPTQAPDQLNALLLEFLAGAAASRSSASAAPGGAHNPRQKRQSKPRAAKGSQREG